MSATSFVCDHKLRNGSGFPLACWVSASWQRSTNAAKAGSVCVFVDSVVIASLLPFRTAGDLTDVDAIGHWVPVAVNDAPLPVLEPVDLGGAQCPCVRLPVHLSGHVLEIDRDCDVV